MRNLSTLSTEEMLDLTAEIMEPLYEIMADKAVSEANSNGGMAKAIPLMIKYHKQSCMELLAALDGVPVSELKLKPLTMLIRLQEVYSMDGMADFVQSSAATQQQQNVSGIATEATGDGAA